MVDLVHGNATRDGGSTRAAGRAMASAAGDILAALSSDQQRIARFPMSDVDERRSWFYTPTHHGGLPLTEMDAAQHRLVLRLVATGLSEPGFVTAATIMGLENVLDHAEGWSMDFDLVRGRDPQLYYLSIFGEPGDSGAWSWRFGGHHLSLHFCLLDGEVVSSTPCFVGADPAISSLLGPGATLRPLGAIEDVARIFITALDERMRERATVSSIAPADIVGANRASLSPGDQPRRLTEVWRQTFTGERRRFWEQQQEKIDADSGLTPDVLASLSFTARPKGVLVSELAEEQQEQAGALLEAYVGLLCDGPAGAYRRLIAQDHGALAFLWAGSTQPFQPHYYRFQGERIFIEYDNKHRGANHIHAVMRDLANDFGTQALAARTP